MHGKAFTRLVARWVYLPALLGVLSSLVPNPATAAPPTNYYLVWSDEFNGNSLNTSNWEYARNGSRNSAYDTPAAVSVANGYLVITTYTAGGTNFTGFIDTANTANGLMASWGYYEASIQYSNAPGQWSAFWLQSPWMMNVLSNGNLGNTNNDPTNGVEINVFEHRCVDGNNSSWINGGDNALHWNGYGPEELSAEWSSQSLGVSSGFHTYGCLWTTNSYTFSVDGNVTWTTSNYMISSAEQLIRLTSEVQSNSWAGTVPTGGYPSQASSQVKMYVDYVRYYAPTNVHFWTGAASANWSQSGNWISNLPPGAASDLTFSYFGAANRTMVMGQDYSVDGLVFLAAKGAFTLNAGNTLTLGAGGIKMVAANYNVTLNNTINVATTQTWTVAPNLTVSGNLAGTSALTKSGIGALILSGPNGFSGTLNADTGSSTNNDGILEITSSASVANVASPIFIRNTGAGRSVLELNAPSAMTIPQTVSLAGRNNSIAAIECVSGNDTLAGGLSLAAGGSNYLIQSDAGTFNLGGTISAGSTATGARTLTLQGNGNFVVSGSIQNGAASAITLVRTNSGTLTISGTNTFTGGTTNWRGVLFVNGLLSGPLVVHGGNLCGTGTVAGATVVQSGCEVSPGVTTANSIGTLSFGNNLTLAAGSTTYLEINAASQTNDHLNVAGALTCGGTLYVANLAGTLAVGQSFNLFNAGSVAGNFSAVVLPPLNAGLVWNTNNLANGILSVVSDSPPEMIAITNPGGNQLQLNWSNGTLQSATNAAGPYSDLTNASSPYPLPPTNAQQYYRVRLQ